MNVSVSQGRGPLQEEDFSVRWGKSALAQQLAQCHEIQDLKLLCARMCATAASARRGQERAKRISSLSTWAGVVLRRALAKLNFLADSAVRARGVCGVMAGRSYGCRLSC